MLEPAAMHSEFHEIEEMVRAAGNYLEVKDVLRAETMEEARGVSRQSSIRLWISIMAVAVVFLAMSASQLRSRPATASPFMADISADSDQIYAAAVRNAAQADVDPSWALVDAFNGLRQRQASLIEDAF